MVQISGENKGHTVCDPQSNSSILLSPHHLHRPMDHPYSNDKNSLRRMDCEEKTLVCEEAVL
jgi:hypothetical protein